jgi:hypothetical protein
MVVLAVFQACLWGRVAVARAEGTDFSEYKLGKLKRLLFYRGIECDHCESKAEWVELMTKSAQLEELPEMKEEWDRLKEYKKKSEQHNTTKEEFLATIKTNMTEPLEDRNADSVWEYFQHQLRDGSIQFQDDGSASFMLPISFHLSQYLHPSAANAVDTVQFGSRQMYFGLPRRWRMKMEKHIDSQVVTMVLGTIIVGLLIILVVDCVQESRSNRDDEETDKPIGEEAVDGKPAKEGAKEKEDANGGAKKK